MTIQGSFRARDIGVVLTNGVNPSSNSTMLVFETSVTQSTTSTPLLLEPTVTDVLHVEHVAMETQTLYHLAEQLTLVWCR